MLISYWIVGISILLFYIYYFFVMCYCDEVIEVENKLKVYIKKLGTGSSTQSKNTAEHCKKIKCADINECLIIRGDNIPNPCPYFQSGKSSRQELMEWWNETNRLKNSIDDFGSESEYWDDRERVFDNYRSLGPAVYSISSCADDTIKEIINTPTPQEK